MKKRIFKPRNGYRYASAIKQWEWTKARGVIVVDICGYKFKSAYTLSEFLKQERPIEITGDVE